MPEEKQDIERFAPQKLMTGFSKSKIPLWVVASVLLHALAIFGSSPSYTYYHVINREAGRRLAEDKRKAEERQKREEDKKRAAEAAKREEAAQAQAADAARRASQPEKPAADKKPTDPQEALMDKHKDKPVIKRITETAKPEDIPKEPDDLNFSIEDTDPL